MSDKNNEARTLAEKHYEVDAGLTHVFRITGPAEVELRTAEPIKLLEINKYTIPSGIMPIRFGPSPISGLNHSCVILEVTPDEYRQIRSEELKLPDGWIVGDLIPRPSAARAD